MTLSPASALASWNPCRPRHRRLGRPRPPYRDGSDRARHHRRVECPCRLTACRLRPRRRSGAPTRWSTRARRAPRSWQAPRSSPSMPRLRRAWPCECPSHTFASPRRRRRGDAKVVETSGWHAIPQWRRAGSPASVASTLAHEVGHLLLDHPRRGRGRPARARADRAGSRVRPAASPPSWRRQTSTGCARSPS